VGRSKACTPTRLRAWVSKASCALSPRTRPIEDLAGDIVTELPCCRAKRETAHLRTGHNSLSEIGRSLQIQNTIAAGTASDSVARDSSFPTWSQSLGKGLSSRLPHSLLLVMTERISRSECWRVTKARTVVWVSLCSEGAITPTACLNERGGGVVRRMFDTLVCHDELTM
jgi:hypothetical protein